LFGWNNFQHEVVSVVETKEEATAKERELILEHKSYLPEFGYNRSKNDSSVEKLCNYVRCIETGELFESGAAAGNSVGKTK
jgi:hypothetical protein